MKTIFKLCMLFFAVALTACKMDPIQEPELPTTTFEGFEVSDDGWITSPEWLAEVVERVAAHSEIGLYPNVYLLEYEGKEYICIHDIFNHSSNSVDHYTFYHLSGELVDFGDYPLSDSMWDLWFKMRNTLSGNGVLIWTQPKENRSALTRVAEWIPFNTPHNKPLNNVYIDNDPITANEMAIIDAFFLNYPNVTRLEPPTRSYNCHAYAWHMTEGGSPVWIDPPIDMYWQDGSFVEIPSMISGAKVVYIGLAYKQNHIPEKTPRAHHSAVAETGNNVISKWGPYDLVRHAKDDTPYNVDSEELGYTMEYKYYKRNTPIVITGPDSTPSNTNVTYSVTTTAQGVTFNNWSITGGSYTITSGGTNNPSSLNVNIHIPSNLQSAG